MKKNAYIGISFIILVFGILFVPKILERIKGGSIVKNDRMSALHSGTHEELAYIKINGTPKKIPDFAFLNQDSLLITNYDYKGKVYVAEFFFVNCPTICPIMNRNLVYLQDQLKKYPDFGIASFSINPGMDRPGVLKRYATQYEVTDPDWHFLTGDRGSIYELATKGFNIYAGAAPEVPGGFEHSGFFALIDQDGYLRSRYDASGNPIIYYRGTVPIAQGESENGEEEQVSALLEDIKKLLTEDE